MATLKKSAQTTHTSVWIAQDTMESRVPRLNVHTNQILVHMHIYSYTYLLSQLVMQSVQNIHFYM